MTTAEHRGATWMLDIVCADLIAHGQVVIAIAVRRHGETVLAPTDDDDGDCVFPAAARLPDVAEIPTRRMVA